MPGMMHMCERCRGRRGRELFYRESEDEYWCQTCIDDADEAAAERQAERDMESPPETSREEHIRTWNEKQRLR